MLAARRATAPVAAAIGDGRMAPLDRPIGGRRRPEMISARAAGRRNTRTEGAGRAGSSPFVPGSCLPFIDEPIVICSGFRETRNGRFNGSRTDVIDTR